MRRMTAAFTRLAGDNRGVTALEYSLLAVVIAVILTVAITNFGQSVSADFNRIANGVGAS